MRTSFDVLNERDERGAHGIEGAGHLERSEEIHGAHLCLDHRADSGLHRGGEIGAFDHAIHAEHVLRQQVQRGPNLSEGRDVLGLQDALWLIEFPRFHLVGDVLHDAIVHSLQIAIHQSLREDQQRCLQRLHRTHRSFLTSLPWNISLYATATWISSSTNSYHRTFPVSPLSRACP